MTRIEGLDALTELEELYLSHNGIERLENLDSQVRVGAGGIAFPACVCSISQCSALRCAQRKLTTLDVACNRLTVLEGLGHMLSLEDLWVRDSVEEFAVMAGS